MCTHTHTHARTSGRYYTGTARIERISLHFHGHIIVREGGSRARWVSARPSSGFRRPEPFLFNEFAAENECALCNSLWLNPLVKAARYNSQFILLYHLLQLNILWVDSSPGARFLSPSVNYAHSDGTWLESIWGTDKAELCVGRIGRFMWRQMYNSVATSLRSCRLLSGHVTACTGNCSISTSISFGKCVTLIYSFTMKEQKRKHTGMNRFCHRFLIQAIKESAEVTILSYKVDYWCVGILWVQST